MYTYFINQWDRLRASFWFVPAIFGALSVLLSIAAPMVDQKIVEQGIDLPAWISTTTQAARASMGAMTGAMVTVTATVFSITIVALSLASQQLGPRLLRRFMDDLPTQVSMGLFIATSFYSLLVLRLIHEDEDTATTLPISVALAVVLTGLSIGALIMFIHHVAMRIQASEVVAAVAGDLDDAMQRLYPEQIGLVREESENEPEPDQGRFPDQEPKIVEATREGYIQGLAGDEIVAIAQEAKLVIELNVRPGDFVVRGMPLAQVWLAGGNVQELWKELQSSVGEAVNEALITGTRRTPRQDLEAAIAELVEVAVRSLSPGINDPFTAMNCIDRLGASLSRLAGRELPSSERYDQDGQLRLLTRHVCFSEALDTAFDQIRQHGRRSVAVSVRLLETLAWIAPCVRRAEDRRAVARQAEMVFRHAVDFPEPEDRNKLAARLGVVKRLLDGAA